MAQNQDFGWLHKECSVFQSKKKMNEFNELLQGVESWDSNMPLAFYIEKTLEACNMTVPLYSDTAEKAFMLRSCLSDGLLLPCN